MAFGARVRELVLRMRAVGVTETHGQVDKLSSSTKNLGANWERLGGAGKAAMGGLTAAATLAVAKVTAIGTATAATGLKVFQTGSELEKYRVQLSTVLKSEEGAVNRLATIRRLAIETPFNVDELVEAGVILEQFGINSEAALRTVTDAAGALAKPVTQAAQAIAVLSTGETEMMKQFGITVPKIEEALGHVWDRKSVAKLQEGTKATIDLLGTMYEGGAQKLALTSQGIISNIQDQWFNMKAKLAEGGFFDAVKDDLRTVLTMLDNFATSGGMDAIAVGFNSAWMKLEDVFFDPFFKKIEDTPVRVAIMAAQVEKIILETAKNVTAATERVRRVWGLLVFATAQGPQAFTEGLMSGDFQGFMDQWDDMMGGFEGGIAREAELEERLNALTRAIDLLGATGGKVTPEIQALLGYTGEQWEKLKGTFQGPLPAPDGRNLELFRDKAGKGFQEIAEAAEEAKKALKAKPFDGALLNADLFSLSGGIKDNARKLGENTGAEFGRGLREHLETLRPEMEQAITDFIPEPKMPKPASIGIRLDQMMASGAPTPDIKAIYTDQYNAVGELDAQAAEARKQREADIAENRAELFGEDLERMAGYYEGLGDMAGMSADERLAHEERYLSGRLSLYRSSEAAVAQMFANMGRYQTVFATQGMNIGRAMNAMLIRGAGEVAKAMIEARIHQAKVDAASYAADALYLAATGQFGAAATMALAAAKKAAIAGIGSIAQGVIEREVQQREAGILGQGEPGGYDVGTGGRVPKFKTADTVRTGAVVNNYYISLEYHINGDYVVSDQKDEATILQELIDSNAVVV